MWQEWGDTDAEGKPIRWSKHHRKPDHHETALLTGSFNVRLQQSHSTHSCPSFLSSHARTVAARQANPETITLFSCVQRWTQENNIIAKQIPKLTNKNGWQEEVKLETTTQASFTPQLARSEAKVGLRETLMAQALMDVAKNLPQDPVPPTDYTTSSDAFKTDVPAPAPIAPEDSLLDKCPLTAYTYNGKHSIRPDGNFGKNSDFSTPPELYLKATMK
eukprot:SAG31_NODE_329_length_17643_cov_10.377793_4_plen_218_part_00